MTYVLAALALFAILPLVLYVMHRLREAEIEEARIEKQRVEAVRVVRRIMRGK